MLFLVQGNVNQASSTPYEIGQAFEVFLLFPSGFSVCMLGKRSKICNICLSLFCKKLIGYKMFSCSFSFSFFFLEVVKFCSYALV